MATYRPDHLELGNWLKEDVQRNAGIVGLEILPRWSDFDWAWIIELRWQDPDGPEGEWVVTVTGPKIAPGPNGNVITTSEVAAPSIIFARSYLVRTIAQMLNVAARIADRLDSHHQPVLP